MDPIDGAVIAAKDNGVNGSACVGIGVELVNGKVLIRLRDVGRCGDTDGAVLLEEPDRVQLVFARVLCHVAALALRPDDGNLIEVCVFGRS